MTFISFNRCFSLSLLLATLGMQGCYDQSTRDSKSPVVGAGSEQTEQSNRTSTVKSQPKLSLHPLSQSVVVNQSITLNTSATAQGVIKYQWRKNGRPIANAVRSNFTISHATLSDAGDYDVLVSSGKASVTSKTAKLTVVEDHRARLTWSAPSKRVDGSPLATTEISAYRIYHSNADGSIGVDYKVEASFHSYELSGLPSGEHYFAVATVDLNGEESDLSEVVSKLIM